MKILGTLALLISLSILAGCQTTRLHQEINPRKVTVSGPVEITKYTIDTDSNKQCSIQGVFIDENNDPIPFLNVRLNHAELSTQTDIDGKFNFQNVPSGNYILQTDPLGIRRCTIEINLEPGNQIDIEAIIAFHVEVELLKPIIYIYPEKKTDVNVELIYDGEITTTYPKYPKNGWQVSASPDGTLVDSNNKEYYSLYWEGKPRSPLGIEDGFVVSKEETIPFLEEKLSLLGLNAKESNEFIIFWLPILEKNNYNLIHFAGDDYLAQAKLNISPTPETLIRVAMVFKGLDEVLDFPIQDLTPLERTRSGFTLVEWGGQELPKEYNVGI